MNLVGVYGGSFDPFHLGHAHVIRVLMERYRFDRFYVVPARKNPHKSQYPGATAKARLEMARIAVAELQDPRVQVLDWELISQEPSFTFTTVTRLSHQEKSPLALILGNEVFEDFPRWHRAQELARLVNLIVVERDPLKTQFEQVIEALALGDLTPDSRRPERLWHSAKTLWFDRQGIDALPYSATTLRNEIAQGRGDKDDSSAPQGIAQSVWQYIKENHLYAVTKGEGNATSL